MLRKGDSEDHAEKRGASGVGRGIVVADAAVVVLRTHEFLYADLSKRPEHHVRERGKQESEEQTARRRLSLPFDPLDNGCRRVGWIFLLQLVFGD